ncbi:hypothetical protein BaRGS_00033119 [Batillaria attramentaria]|uniref:Syndecan n=1 Tax=Batillaria attramentaria TaxID=370345 RepID=A0ABD0JL77_9CAEN
MRYPVCVLQDEGQDGVWSEQEDPSGSGSGDDLVTDDEDMVPSGSGSGGAAVPEYTDTTIFTPVRITTPRPVKPEALTPCEQLREASKHLMGNFVPKCTDSGDYDSRQCRGHPGTGTCWCADLGGREIPGKNLPPCVFQLVKHSRSRQLGSFRPVCTLTGEFESKQCMGSMCFCVDKKNGVKEPGTEVYLPDDPNCDDQGYTPGILSAPEGAKVDKGDKDEDKTEKPPKGDTDDKDEDKTEKPPVSNETGDSGPMKEPSSAAHVMTQPGILAAIIGGSVVFLLCAVLLIMFIVYRMRKKDEGSYALDEPKKMPNYSYQRAPDREFYA